LPRFNTERRTTGKPTLDFGVALHLGEVLYANIGSSERLDFTVVGSAVNEATRIEGLCRHCSHSPRVAASRRSYSQSRTLGQSGSPPQSRHGNRPEQSWESTLKTRVNRRTVDLDGYPDLQ
jgi:class 3 adenylate cyclase